MKNKTEAVLGYIGGLILLGCFVKQFPWLCLGLLTCAVIVGIANGIKNKKK